MNQNLPIGKICIFLFAFFFNLQINAQTNLPILLKAEKVLPVEDRTVSKVTFDLAKTDKSSGAYRIIQFKEIPSTTVKQNLKSNGIELLNYLPKNAFYAKISANANWQALIDSKLHAVLPIKNNYKLSKDLAEKKYNDWAVIDNKIALNGVFYKTESKSKIALALSNIGAEILLINEANIVNFMIEISDLDKVYSLTSFYYFEQVDPPGEPENLVGVTNHRSNTLATSYDNGLKFDGSGITVMLQDNSRLDEHIDYTGRFTNDPGSSNSGDHGEHCGGIIAGAGNLDPTARGMAFGAEVLVYNPSDNNYNDVPSLYTNSNLTITSKSYSGGLNAGYNSLASQLDQQVRTMPELIHVFSAGNSNGSGFTAAGSQWFNITGGHKSAKNVLAVGNVTLIDILANSSSRGPSADGRIKPDICAVGSNVYSTVDPNTYDNKTGTSMACPAVAGTLAQLYEAYKTLNGGSNPESALMKATILNSADDLGNPGPDFKFGWGRINGRRAYNIISNNQYFSDNISQGDSLVHSINVPAGIAQVRIMIHWSDHEASPSAGQVLVNDINMQVTTPSGANVDPWVLDNTPNAALLDANAVQSTDDVNNMEQVTIDAPQSGTYTVNLEGFSIPSGPQKYYVVYELLTDDVVLTYPIGGEGFDSDKNEFIRWDALYNNGTFALEYSADNGATWNSIAANIGASTRQFSWNVPPIITGEALIRVTRGASSSQSHENFSIIRVPDNLNVPSVCPDSVTLAWNAVAGATGYEVSMLGDFYMDSVGTTTTNSITVAHSSTDEFWWSVKALGPNNCVGRRAIAKYQGPGTFNCTLHTDIALSDQQGLDGRTILTCMETDSLDIGITLENNGASPLTNVPVKYELNNGTTVSEVYAGTIQPNSSFYYSFNNQPAIPYGMNELSIWAEYPGDQDSSNDSIYAEFDYLNSPPVTLPFFENFESFALCGTASDCELEQCGLSNDFFNAKNGAVDDIDWRTNDGPTPSAGTGPTVDFNPGTASGNYLYIEPSSTPVCSNKQAHLITPCIDMGVGGVLNFAYHMNGSDMGRLHVDILVNGTWTNDIMTPLAGNKGTNWLQQSINLNSYAGSIVNIRFRGVTGNNFRSDLAIDDIKITSSLDDETNQINSFKLYPNPSNGILFYQLNQDSQNKDIYVIDANGKIVYKANDIKNNGSIDLSHVSKGIYFVKVIMDADTSIQKMILQ